MRNPSRVDKVKKPCTCGNAGGVTKRDDARLLTWRDYKDRKEIDTYTCRI